ncbi:MAG: OmpA family protein [Labilithrix sp.]|nr:OmpA family protein [Labilithrix sp.]MCW5813459.1 OmpA family protein [Labilithrix sp.]
MDPRLFARCASIASLVALTTSGSAAAGGFNLNRFEPAERGSRWFVLDSLDLKGHGRPAAGLTLDYQYQPIAIKGPDSEVRAAVVGHVVTTHAGANVVLWDRVRVGASLPVLLYNEGTTAGLRGETFYRPQNEQGIGDLRFGADARLFGTAESPITVAFGGRLWLPTGSPTSYTSDGFVRGGPRLSAAGKVSYFVYGATIGAMFRSPQTRIFADTAIDHDLTFGVSAGASLADGKVTIGPELYGSTVLGDAAFKTRSTPLEVLLGGHVRLPFGLRAGAGVGTAVTAGYGSPQVRVVGSIEWVMDPELDTDGDGILDKDDACPRVVGTPSTDPARNGCVNVDTDGDGIVDEEDACADVYGVRTKDKRTNGCDDRDKDGIMDPLDACPNEAGPANADPSKNGCVIHTDKDEDGIWDEDDACPDKAGPKTDDPKTNGCPDPDRDKDGIPNEADACPDNAGPAHANPARNGCPIAFISGGEIRIKEQVNFVVGSYTLSTGKETLEVLEAVREILSAHPEITRVRVEGHTDNRGNPAWNKKLSDARAAAVVNWLVRKGIAKTRLTSVGWGQERPLEANDTDQGRALNRRVEFHIESSEAAKPSP